MKIRRYVLYPHAVGLFRELPSEYGGFVGAAMGLQDTDN